MQQPNSLFVHLWWRWTAASTVTQTPSFKMAAATAPAWRRQMEDRCLAELNNPWVFPNPRRYKEISASRFRSILSPAWTSSADAIFYLTSGIHLRRHVALYLHQITVFSPTTEKFQVTALWGTLATLKIYYYQYQDLPNHTNTINVMLCHNFLKP